MFAPAARFDQLDGASFVFLFFFPFPFESWWRGETRYIPPISESKAVQQKNGVTLFVAAA